MTFKEIEEEIFFDAFHTLDGGLKNWFERELIVNTAATKIAVNRTNEIFDGFSATGVKYIEDTDNKVFRISASGKIYYEYLKKASTKSALDTKAVEASIKTSEASITTVKWTKWNIKIGILISVTTLSVVLFTCHRDTDRYNKEAAQQLKDTSRQGQVNRTYQELNQRLQEISQHLSDTAKVKVKILK